ncbi:hypothetical protein FA210_28315, partial [Pseudomonas aeruginosa]|nr:hypothetical protein [Pseudomonas aeruginosa]MCO3489689.1 hypothetical protein [Pseudomonas aeruginosa]
MWKGQPPEGVFEHIPPARQGGAKSHGLRILWSARGFRRDGRRRGPLAGNKKNKRHESMERRRFSAALQGQNLRFTGAG